MKAPIPASRQRATPRVSDRVLFPGKVVRIAAGDGGLLRAREGVLWVTFEASASPERWAMKDHFIACGEAVSLDPGDVVVVGPSDARYGMASLDWQPRVLPARRGFMAWLRGLLPGRSGGLLAT